MLPVLTYIGSTPIRAYSSLGVCLYQMLTERLPPAFGLEAPIPPSHFNQAASPALDHAVLKALRPDLKRRYATAQELISALKQAAA